MAFRHLVVQLYMVCHRSLMYHIQSTFENILFVRRKDCHYIHNWICLADPAIYPFFDLYPTIEEYKQAPGINLAFMSIFYSWIVSS